MTEPEQTEPRPCSACSHVFMLNQRCIGNPDYLCKFCCWSSHEQAYVWAPMMVIEEEASIFD